MIQYATKAESLFSSNKYKIEFLINCLSKLERVREDKNLNTDFT